MDLRIVSLLCLKLIVGIDSGRVSRIVGGEEASVRDFTYVASLRLESNNQHFCGAVIVSRFHLLTVAHCMSDKRDTLEEVAIYTGTSRIGNRSGWKHKIQHLYIYDDYVLDQRIVDLQRHDLAIIQIEEALTFNRYQRKIELPNEDIEIGTNVMTTGWGLLNFYTNEHTDVLQKLPLRILEKSVCKYSIQRELHEEHFCAFNKFGAGMCLGDSGGAAVSEGKLVGLMTYIIPCGRGYPDVFINIYHYVGFIRSVIE